MPAPAPCPPSSSGSYRRREPEHSLLYRVVAAEIDALREELAAASPYGSGLPKHVDKEIDGFLSCGILARGFCRVVCRRCRAEHLVAFSCKSRSICPSCTARRMHNSAAALVDRVFPHVPVRQWVTTFPRRVRYHLAADPKIATEALREVTRVIFAWQRKRARAVGARPGRANSNGAVTMIQRFNSALEASLHFHSLIPDGVFVCDGDDPDVRPRFVEIDPPTNEEVAELLDQIIVRIIALLRRRGRLDDDALDQEPEPHLLLAARPARSNGGPFVEEPLPPRCARRDGFSLHAGIGIHMKDREGLEKLARYCLRPPLAQGRLSEAEDGTLRYEMKRRFTDGRHVLSFEPREFVARLCALVPPKGFHMIRYAGIFSAHARGRHGLTGRGLHDEPLTIAARPAPTSADGAAAARAAAPATPSLPTTPSAGTAPATRAPSPAAAASPSVAAPTRSSKEAGPPLRDDAAGPDDAGRQRRLAWAVLMRRSFGLDVLCCPRCSSRMDLISAVEDERVAARILAHLGLPQRAPPRGRPWRPQRAPSLALERLADDGADPPAVYD